MLPPLQALEGGVKRPAFPKEGFAAFQGPGNPDGSLRWERGQSHSHRPELLCAPEGFSFRGAAERNGAVGVGHTMPGLVAQLGAPLAVSLW